MGQTEELGHSRAHCFSQQNLLGSAGRNVVEEEIGKGQNG